MKADRLLAILQTLQRQGRVTARGLADVLEVSVRTIHRDMEALGMAGIPVIAERGYGGGWSLPEGYRTRLTALTAGEIAALLMISSSSAVEDLGLAGSARGAIAKLLAALPDGPRRDAETVRERIHVDGAGWRPKAAHDAAALAEVQRAVWEERKLAIRYRPAVEGGSGEPAERIVCPLGLVAKMSAWYMAGMTEDGQVRTYRISRIAAVRVLEETFRRPAGFDLAAYWEASTERFQAALPRYAARVGVSAARWEQFRRERYVYPAVTRPREDGWIEAEVEFHTLESACAILLSYGRHAAAYAPEELREALRGELAAAAARYGG